MTNIDKLKIFSWVNKETVLQIMMNAEEKEFHKWEIIFIEWAPSNWEWYIIKKWKLKISIKWEEIAILSDWDIVWEIALLNEEERSATVEALENTEVIVITIDSLINIIDNDDNSINKEIIRRIEDNIKNTYF